jgi:hypothetical protein
LLALNDDWPSVEEEENTKEEYNNNWRDEIGVYLAYVYHCHHD